MREASPGALGAQVPTRSPVVLGLPWYSYVMPKRQPTILVAVRMPKAWVDEADRLAAVMSKPGLELTRTDVFRMAIAEGMKQVAEPRG